LTSNSFGDLPAARNDLPLELDVQVVPENSPAGAPVTLELVLRNRSTNMVTVNARLLITPGGELGEIAIDVDGPDGYLNEAGFRVRAGEPGPEDFADLRPGGEIRRSWSLARYQSLHLPGDYRLTATYHNEIPTAPDGRPVIAGKLSAACEFRRIQRAQTQES